MIALERAGVVCTLWTGQEAGVGEFAGDGASLEAAADELIRTHGGFGRRSGIYREDSLIRRGRREISLEEIAEQHGYQLLIPDQALRRLIGQALDAACTRPQALVWALEESGLGQREIARILGISQQAVSRRMQRARAKLWDHFDDGSPAFVIFCRESHRYSYHAPPHRPPLPEEVQAARRILEAQGWETWILSEDQRAVLLAKRGIIHRQVTFAELLREAGLARPRRRRKKS
jgi:DNA-binding CsgD family transcriptional regulator